MKKRYVFVIITIFFTVACKKDIPNQQIAISKVSQSNKVYNPEQKQKDLNIEKYVNSIEGLRVRNLPGINGEKIGLMDYLTKVNIIKEDNNYEIIDGIKDKWVYINTPLEGWVFNGYLIDIYNLRKLIIGSWMDLWNVFSFYENGEFETLQLESSYTGHGYWEIEIEDKNIVITINREVQDSGEYSADKMAKYRFYIDDDILKLMNQELEVKRLLMKCEKEKRWESYKLYIERFGLE